MTQVNLLPPETRQRQKTRRVLSIQHMNNEDDFGSTEITFNRLPFVFSVLTAEVMDRQTQVKFVLTIDLALRIAQRREQT